MSIRPLILALGASMIASTVVVPAAAEQSGRASVSYADLDLSTDAGRAELAARYDRAARKMCGAGEDGKLRGKERHCYESTSRSLKARVATILKQHEGANGG